MKFTPPPAHLDIKAFASSAGRHSGRDLLQNYERLMAESRGLGGENTINWEALGELRPSATGAHEVWLHLAAELQMPLTCQRCLERVDEPVRVLRDYRFVATEAQALIEDETADEEVLVLSRDFDLASLLEDEVLMELPVVPKHDVCPTTVKLSVADAAFEADEAAAPRKAFAGLDSLLAPNVQGKTPPKG